MLRDTSRPQWMQTAPRVSNLTTNTSRTIWGRLEVHVGKLLAHLAAHYPEVGKEIGALDAASEPGGTMSGEDAVAHLDRMMSLELAELRSEVIDIEIEHSDLP